MVIPAAIMCDQKTQQPSFIDLFSGCGGLSLGLLQAGFNGVFAIEKAEDAFKTFKANLIDNATGSRFVWPSWLDKKHIGIEDFLAKHRHRLPSLRGKVSVIAGGPPCQGFSFAGRRNDKDPRNWLFQKYVEFVAEVQPQMLLLENVPGMKVPHGATQRRNKPHPGKKSKSYYEKLIEELDSIGYTAEGRLLDATSFGVPQRRPRLVVIGIKKLLLRKLPDGVPEIFAQIEACASAQIRQLGLSCPVSASDAISDLEVRGNKTIPCLDPASPKGFSTLAYVRPLTPYQKLMHKGTPRNDMDSMRLVRHTETVKKRFAFILKECRRGFNLSKLDRQKYGLLKHRTLPMSPTKPAPTLTTLPDDVLHYAEPRILTVREYARIQSFPDWYKFCGKYTSGGMRRKRDCPRYTQVGNAVPPLLAQAIGSSILITLERLAKESTSSVALKHSLVPKCNALAALSLEKYKAYDPNHSVSGPRIASR